MHKAIKAAAEAAKTSGAKVIVKTKLKVKPDGKSMTRAMGRKR